MKVSLTWLKEYVEIPWSVEELSERLTSAGLEVEGVDDQAASLAGFVVGHVIAHEKHPKADRLSVCTVDVGSETLQIVCGAPNVAQGQKVIVGLVGATVPHNQHDPEGKPFVLGKVTLRGVSSHGMICSEQELGLGDDGDGIMVLPEDSTVGSAAADALGATDVVLEVALTPNRADCVSHIGIARDIAALTGSSVTYPSVSISEQGPPAADLASLEIRDPDLCPRYSARILSNVSMQQSPEWLQERLRAVGMRPLNVVVDVTNYVMLESGQPLHAFDLDEIHAGKIVVRRAGTDSTFTTLDEKERTLTPDTIMICDADRAVAVGGVMGGLNSEITAKTTRVLIESASFHASSIRRTARAFGLSTEASYRFERGVDPDLTVRAADRAAALIQSLTGATIHSGCLDAYPGKKEREAIVFRPQRTNELLGTDIPDQDMQSYLERLGCAVQVGRDGAYHVTPPSYRMDMEQEIDLVEEVARIYGYDNVETLTKAAIDFSSRAASVTIADTIRSILIGFGYNEIMTLSMQKQGVAELSTDRPIRVLNPVSAEMQALRPSLIPEALGVVRSNIHRSRETLRLFEVGTVFSSSAKGKRSNRDDYKEEQHLLILQTGMRQPGSFNGSPEPVDLFDLKGDVEGLLKQLHLDKYRFIPYDARKTLTEQAISVDINGQSVGTLGLIRAEIARQFDLDVPVFVCELSLSGMGEGLASDRQYVALPRYPSVQRDLAFVVGGQVSHAAMIASIQETAGPLLESVDLFDTYTGDRIGFGMKSLAYSLVFRSEKGTLKDNEVDTVIALIVKRVTRDHAAQLRA